MRNLRQFLVLLSMGILCNAFAGKPPVKVTVYFTNSYCGGAYPPKEILESFQKERLMINSTILLKSKGNKSITVKTDNKGVFTSPLAAGTYDMYMTKNYSDTMGCAFNYRCEMWLQHCFGQLTITKGNKTHYKFVFSFGCNPCEPPRP